jgi:gluconolactonase
MCGLVLPSVSRAQNASPKSKRLHQPLVRKVRGGFTFTEGPVCDRRGDLYFSDVGEERIYCLSKDSLHVVRNSSNLANGLAFDQQGRMIVCERGRLTRTERDGRLTILAESFDGKGLHWPNDVVVRSDGSIFFTDLKQKKEWANPAKTNFNAVYLLSPDSKLTLFSTECEAPNGIALSPKEDLLYVVDTDRRNIRTYDVDGGGTRRGRIFAGTSTAGAPDGIKTDRDGNVWVCEQEGVILFGPAGDRVLTIKISEQPSNCAFANDQSVLFVTARTSIYELDFGSPL